MSMASIVTTRRGKPIDAWRWVGRIFLVMMLFYTAMPMAWMLLTSIKSGFAAMQFPPQWLPNELDARELREAARSK